MRFSLVNVCSSFSNPPLSDLLGRNERLNTLHAMLEDEAKARGQSSLASRRECEAIREIIHGGEVLSFYVVVKTLTDSDRNFIV